jgi:hypothetical protein
MEERLLKKRVKGGNIYALIHIPTNNDEYVLRTYDADGLVSASKFESEGKAKESLDRVTEW